MSGKNKKDPKIEYGMVNIDLSNLEPSEIKVRISTMIDEDILLKLKKIPKPDDAADACAIAWAGLSRTKFI